MPEIPIGYCHCGCGNKSDIDKKSRILKYIRGHRPKGRYKNSIGYIVRAAPDHPRAYRGYVYEHILVAEQTIGRFITGQEEVHHINGIRHDNHPENLMVCKDHTEHFKVHQRQRAEKECGDPDKRQCTFCKQWDEPANLNRLTGSAYHKECARKETKRRYNAGLSIRNGKNGGKVPDKQFSVLKAQKLQGA